jgi:hypothetical protein
MSCVMQLLSWIRPPCRRGQRLKAISRQLTSPVARQALAHFWQGSWVVMGLLAMAHVVCFIIFLGIVRVRQR